MSFHDTDRCLDHSGLPTWACPDCIFEYDQTQSEAAEVAESLPAAEYLWRFTPAEVLEGSE